MTIHLQGLRVLTTRPLQQNMALNDLIKEAGGYPLACPALEIIALEPSWFSRLPDFARIQQAIFISANAVEYGLAAFSEKNILWPGHIRVTAVGAATARALQSRQVPVNHMPAIADSEHLLMLESLQDIHQETILLFKGEGGRTLITETLQKRGARLLELPVYRRSLPDFNQEKLHGWWRDNAVDIILFTSGEAIQNVFTMFGKNAHEWLRSLPCLVISERLAEAASLAGMSTVLIGQSDTIIESLHRFNKGRVHGTY